MSKGKEETSRLRENVEQQLNRLLQQLQDLEELKDDLSPEEIVEQRDETIKQMSEFKESLARMMSGNVTLVDDFGRIQLVCWDGNRCCESPSL